jgi:hypothetical protein
MIILRYYKKNNQSAAVAGPRLLFLLIIAVLFSGVQGQSTLSQSGSDAFSTSSESNDDTGGDSTSLAASAAAALKEILVSRCSVESNHYMVLIFVQLFFPFLLPIDPNSLTPELLKTRNTEFGESPSRWQQGEVNDSGRVQSHPLHQERIQHSWRDRIHKEDF